MSSYCTKEASFVYAITTAGVTYAITQACSLGNLQNCGCDENKRDGRLTPDGWRWGGCSADIKYGLRMTRKFMDAREVSKTARSFMNLHNNRAGRKLATIHFWTCVMARQPAGHHRGSWVSETNGISSHWAWSRTFSLAPGKRLERRFTDSEVENDYDNDKDNNLEDC
ncbi:protein Wnt [Elysia marginata]|uniref:Protein Wnt n=1 Tax=Elysia marginata TaxID=1093978 RepID=A0AAV4H3H3_9GAST|nr:protein Wnt [Elysia marginata]